MNNIQDDDLNHRYSWDIYLSWIQCSENCFGQQANKFLLGETKKMLLLWRATSLKHWQQSTNWTEQIKNERWVCVLMKEITNSVPCPLLWDIPIKALAIVIFSHILSRTSRPDSGQAMALATVAMSLWMERWKSSNPEKDQRKRVQVITGAEPHPPVRAELVWVSNRPEIFMFKHTEPVLRTKKLISHKYHKRWGLFCFLQI